MNRPDRKPDEPREIEQTAPDAAEPVDLTSLLYEELRSVASVLLRNQVDRHTLQPTALVHELYLRFSSRGPRQWHNQAHFMAVAARAMRQILADYARRASAQKRGGGRARATLKDLADAPSTDEIDLIALDLALTRLSELHDRQASVVELRFLVGLSADEVAHVLGISKETVKRDWRMAQAWLMNEMSEQEPR